MPSIEAEISRARANNLGPCGTTITQHGDGRDMTDDQGHAVAVVHAAPALRHAAGIRAVTQLHRPNPEGFIPMCRECGKPSPCPTLLAVTEEKTNGD